PPVVSTPFPTRRSSDLALASKPALRADPEAPSMFAIGRIAAAFRAILDETGHNATTLAAGSWRFDYIRAADAFMPPGVTLIPLEDRKSTRLNSSHDQIS